MKAALESADRDSGGGFLAQLQSLDVVDQMSWPTMTWPSIEKIAPRLVEALGIAPAHLAMTPDPSGDGPVRLLNEAANRIANGETEIAAVVGGEALRTGAKRAAMQAQRSAAAGQAPKQDLLRDVAEQHFKPILRKYGLLAATDIYPLYENACRAAWGQNLAEAQLESALIWSGMSAIAADNPDAWIRTRYTPDQILTPSADNRPVTFPYNKLMVANNSVNQGAAVIVTSLARATAAGIAENRLVYVGAGAAAHEPDDFLKPRWLRPFCRNGGLAHRGSGGKRPANHRSRLCRVLQLFPLYPQDGAPGARLAAGSTAQRLRRPDLSAVRRSETV